MWIRRLHLIVPVLSAFSFALQCSMNSDYLFSTVFLYIDYSMYLFLLIAVHSLPHLTVLSLSGCSKVTDDGIELIAENLQKLRALDLSWCPRITDASLEYIACDLNQLEELTLDR